MKNLKKVLSVVVLTALISAMSISAFASEIITSPVVCDVCTKEINVQLQDEGDFCQCNSASTIIEEEVDQIY